MTPTFYLIFGRLVKLRPNGLWVIHISNREVSLQPIGGFGHGGLFHLRLFFFRKATKKIINRSTIYRA